MLKVFEDFIKQLFQINDYWSLFTSFAKQHSFFAIVVAAAVILFVADFIVEQSRELHQRFNALMKKTRGRVFIVVSVAISFLIAYQSARCEINCRPAGDHSAELRDWRAVKY
jgi:hypothetical protein